jgi:hypothetical protein
MPVTKLLGWNLILLLIAGAAPGALYPMKTVSHGLGSEHELQMATESGEPWSTFAVAAHYYFRDLPNYGKDIEVGYDFWASFLSPLDTIPIKIHLANTIFDQRVQFVVAIFVEAPTGIIIGRLRGGDEIRQLAMGDSFDGTVSYTVPFEWHGYDLQFHSIVWVNDESRLSYYHPFLPWTLPSIVTITQAGQPVARFVLYILGLGLIPSALMPQRLKEKSLRYWEKSKLRVRIGLTALIFLIYVGLWLLIVAAQYAHP